MREKITVKIPIDFSGRMNTQTAIRGDQVFVGTGQGKVFAIDTNAGNVVEQPVKLPKPSPGTQMTGGTILRIVALDTSSIFGVLLAAIEKKADGSAPLGVPAVQNYILRLDNGTWSPTSATGLPNELLFGFVAVVAPNSEIPRGLLAATDDAVYISRDDSKTWQRASIGLPRRPHCGDLRFAILPVGGPTVILGTFGRSMWVATLT
jgi:outer membrane protein assembly factor BamB